MIGVRPDGTKELITVEDGYRESAESWKTVLRDLKRRGMHPPVVAVGDGALGFWAAVRDVWPTTREQRDWFHRLENIRDKLPKRLQPRVKAALREVMYAETREQAREAITRFATEYGAKYPKAVTTLEKDADALLTFFEFPAEHCAPANVQRDRIPVRDGAAPSARHEGGGIEDEGPLDGLQAAGHGTNPLASIRWRGPAAARPGWRRLRGRCAARD
jgi:Transposase, Mutator family